MIMKTTRTGLMPEEEYCLFWYFILRRFLSN